MIFDFPEFIKVFNNALSQLIIRLSGAVTTFLVTILITRYLGISTLGSFVKITSFVALFYLLVDFGLNTVYLKQFFHKAEDFFGNLVFLRLLISCSVFTLVCLITVFLPEGKDTGYALSDKVGILFFSVTIFTEGILSSFNGLLQKTLEQNKMVIPSIASSAVVLAGVTAGVLLHNIFIILIAYPLGDAAQILATRLSLKNKVVYSLTPVSFKTFSKSSLVSATPFAIMLFLNVVYFRADAFILSILKSTTEVGIYGFSYKIFEFLISFPTFLSASVFPILIQSSSNNAVFRQKVFSYSVVLFGVSIILLVLVFIFSPLITLIRSDLFPAVLSLRILAFSLPFFFLTSLFQWALLLKEKVRALVIIYAGTMIINIALNVIYIPQYSYIAASIITLATEIIVFLCMTVLFLQLKIKRS